MSEFYYGTLTEAEAYFSEHLDARSWEVAGIPERTAALVQATRAVERLNFAGEVPEGQTTQFPRETDTAVPTDIERAVYEEALARLDGFKLVHETNNIGVTGNTYANTRMTYGEGYVAEHVRAGILSIEAWYYLKPYLRDIAAISLGRVT